MSTAVRLPSELRAFLALPGPQSLLVRGPPGSGKSTLCLALLEAAVGQKVLVTSRVSSGELHREFPWLGKDDSGIQIVDSSRVDLPLQVERGVKRELNVLDEPDRSVRQEIFEFLNLPSPVQEAWSRLPLNGPSVVVIDSWDALVEHYLGIRGGEPADRLSREEVERMLFRRMNRAPCHLVLVLEREEQSQLDYLLNGVVVTRREINADRLERWLALPKLRGIRVANSLYPYTVEGARFQCIEPVVGSADVRRGGYDPEPNPLPQHLWPGSRSFADAFGRLPLGKVSLLEADEDVPNQLLQALFQPAIRFVLGSGGRALILPSVATSPEELRTMVEGSASPADLARTLRVVDVGGRFATQPPGGAPGLEGSLVSPATLIPTLSNPDAQGREMTEWLQAPGERGAPGIVLLHETGLESLVSAAGITLTPDVAATFLAGLQATLGSASLHVVMIGSPSAVLYRSVRAIAALRLRLHNRHGRVFLYGQKPWTPGFVMADSGNSLPYDLLRIV
jgi:KaiC/GvpD/RAD55 family RecA-like ATPase